VDFQALLSESILARIQFIVRTPAGIPRDVDPGELERKMVEASRSWADMLRDALIDAHGEEDGNRLYHAYREGIPLAYQEQMPARAAVADLDRVDRLAQGESDLEMSLYRALEDDNTLVCFKLCRAGSGIPLSDVLPVLENMGLRVIHEQPYSFVAGDGRVFSLHDFAMHRTEAGEIDIQQVRGNFQDTFAQVWRGEAQNDGFNQLVLGAGLDWRQVTVLRACCKYLLQVGSPFSQAYMEQTLASNPTLAGQLALLFEVSFDPDLRGDRAAKVAQLDTRIREELEAVANLDEDRILRRYLRLIRAMLRTNYYQPGPEGARHKAYLSFKIRSSEVPDMPLPHPAYETG
jgi:glutamate dehydrogenase